MFRLHVGYERGTHDAARMLTSPVAGQLFSRFVQISDRVTTRPLTAGNMVEMLQTANRPTRQCWQRSMVRSIAFCW